MSIALRATPAPTHKLVSGVLSVKETNKESTITSNDTSEQDGTSWLGSSAGISAK